MLSVASSSHACRERVGGDHDHRRSWVWGDRQGVQEGDSHVGGGPRATTDWLSWHRACPRLAPVHNLYFIIHHIYIYVCVCVCVCCAFMLSEFYENHMHNISIIWVLLVQVWVAAMLRFFVVWVTCRYSEYVIIIITLMIKWWKEKWRPRPRGLAWLHCFPYLCQLRTIHCCGW